MDRKNMLDVLNRDIENIESQIKFLNDNISSLTEKLGGLKKTFSFFLKEEDSMAREITKENQTVIQLKNGQVNVPYEEFIDLKAFNISEEMIIEFDGIDQIQWNSEEHKFEGVLTSPGEFFGTICCWEKTDDNSKGNLLSKREVHILINADPKSLWKNIDPPLDGKYYKKNSAFDYENSNGRTLVGASIRGKSHAQKGTFRDDHFEIRSWDNGWNLQVVGDGAGSAEYSREGSKIACESIVKKISEFIEQGKIKSLESYLSDFISIREHTEECVDTEKIDIKDDCELFPFKEALESSITAEDLIPHEGIDLHKFEEKKDTDTSTCLDKEVINKKLPALIHELTVMSAYFAFQEIKKFADESDLSIKKFASTVLFAFTKEFEFGTIVISFSIGDGAIGVVTDNKGVLLMNPDGGEYSGQTRFVTMKEIFQSKDIYNRSKLQLFRDKVEAIILMTDGVSDPKFGTDNNLNNSDMWLNFWSDLKPILSNGDVKEEEILQWLDFYEKGEYDDRTITILS